MMKSLLLYNNNISPDFVQDFRDYIGETKPFSITNQTLAREDYSFDLVASEFLKSMPNNKYDAIFIPINLSVDNYLEFSGLRIGYHIRLTSEFNNQETPIVFMARESAFEINKLSFLGEILGCPQIYMTDKLEIDDFVRQIEFIQSTSKENVLKAFLDRIHIKPTGNYTTHHTIANEWSILRWFKTILKSEIIDYIPEEIESIESKINSNLYYKYLTCKFPVNNVQGLSVEDLKLKFNGKILYIDDEKDKGWNKLFCTLFYDGIINKVENYESFGSEFKELEKDEIIKLSVNKAKDFDLVILDFRLTEDDFYETDPKKITGYKILEGIKAYNKGIQVVVFSATNKVWNLQALQDAGADGFIVKESPENIIDKYFTVESLKNVTTIADNCLERKYLKQIEILKISIEKSFSSNPLSKYYPNDLRILRGIQYQNLLLTELTAISDILSSKNENRFNHAMLMQFKIIECIIEIFIPEKINGKWIFWDKTEMQYFYVEDSKIYKSNAELCFYDSNIKKKKVMKIPHYEYNSSRNKIDCLIEQKIAIDNKNDIHKKLKNIIDYRNSFIHPKDRLALKILSSSEILKWMELINEIITKI